MVKSSLKIKGMAHEFLLQGRGLDEMTFVKGDRHLAEGLYPDLKTPSQEELDREDVASLCPGKLD